jgi:hypothetical protein
MEDTHMADDVLKLSKTQLAFPNPEFKDKDGAVVDLTTLSPVFASADSAVVMWEKRDPAGKSDPAGKDAVVAQGLGKTQVSCVATNPDGTQVTITGDVEVVAEDAISGSMNWGPVVEKSL